MSESGNQEQLEIRGIRSDYKVFTQLKDLSDDIIFIHPTTSSFFDKLTNFRFVHNEIAVPSEQKFDFGQGVTIDKISSPIFKIFKSYSLDFQIKFDSGKFNFKCMSPEFAIAWILQDFNSLSVGIALALLEFSNLELLNQYQKLFTSPNILRFLLELGQTALNRYDLIWQTIEKNGFETELGDLPLFLDRNIRLERKYDKIL